MSNNATIIKELKEYLTSEGVFQENDLLELKPIYRKDSFIIKEFRVQPKSYEHRSYVKKYVVIPHQVASTKNISANIIERIRNLRELIVSEMALIKKEKEERIDKAKEKALKKASLIADISKEFSPDFVKSEVYEQIFEDVFISDSLKPHSPILKLSIKSEDRVEFQVSNITQENLLLIKNQILAINKILKEGK